MSESGKFTTELVDIGTPGVDLYTLIKSDTLFNNASLVYFIWVVIALSNADKKKIKIKIKRDLKK